MTPATRQERSWYLYAGIVLGLLVIIALAVFVNDLVGTTGSQEGQLSELRKELQQKNEILGILKAPRIEMVSLSGIEPGSVFYGKILWDSSSRDALVQVGGVPAAPDGKEYQLWMQKEKKYFSIGEFQIDSATPGIFKVISLPLGERQQIEGFALTLEPKGGSPQPTGAIFLRGAR